MNDELEIIGDMIADVNEAEEAAESAPVVELNGDELEDWYQGWLLDQE